MHPSCGSVCTVILGIVAHAYVGIRSDRPAVSPERKIHGTVFPDIHELGSDPAEDIPILRNCSFLLIARYFEIGVDIANTLIFMEKISQSNVVSLIAFKLRPHLLFRRQIIIRPP